MKIGILLAIGVAMLAFGVSGLVVRANAVQAEKQDDWKMVQQYQRPWKDCTKRDFINEFVTRYGNSKPFSNEERASYAVGIGLAVLAESLSCGR